jgi:hypothetical protein
MVLKKQKAMEVSPADLLDAALEALSQLGHGQLWCVCGYVIWTCNCKKKLCQPKRMIITDHSRCISAKK